MILKKIQYLALFSILCTTLEALPRKDYVICIPIPKCGTHLLMKMLSLLGEPGFKFNHNQDLAPSARLLSMYKKVNTQKPPNHYRGRHYPNIKAPYLPLLNETQRLCNVHWPYLAEAEKYLDTITQADFFMFRDPRAMLVSMAFMLKDAPAGSLSEGQTTDPKNLMWDFINGKQKNFIQWGVEINQLYPLLWEKGVVEFYKLYMPWMKAKKFFTVRFEDLVGSRGGGSDEVQAKTIYAIAKHVGITLTPEKFDYVRSNMFGDSTTFREGSIDGWKKHFTPAMKKAFKKVPGANQLLIELGYEKDENW
jgi:hypothetical protein